MGDWRAVNWDALDTHTLVHILSGVWGVLANRLLIRFPFQPSQNIPVPPVVSPSAVISEPTAESQTNPLLVPHRCQFPAGGVIFPVVVQDKDIDTIPATTAGTCDEEKMERAISKKGHTEDLRFW